MLINVFSSQARYIDYPYVGKQSVENYVITMIDCGETYVDVYFWCKDIRNKRRYFSIYTYLILPNGYKCQISSLNGKALDFDNFYMSIHKKGMSLVFRLDSQFRLKTLTGLVL